MLLIGGHFLFTHLRLKRLKQPTVQYVFVCRFNGHKSQDIAAAANCLWYQHTAVSKVSRQMLHTASDAFCCTANSAYDME